MLYIYLVRLSTLFFPWPPSQLPGYLFWHQNNCCFPSRNQMHDSMQPTWALCWIYCPCQYGLGGNLSVCLSVHPSCFWFLHIYLQNAQWTDFKLGRYIHYVAPLNWFRDALSNSLNYSKWQHVLCLLCLTYLQHYVETLFRCANQHVVADGLFHFWHQDCYWIAAWIL